MIVIVILFLLGRCWHHLSIFWVAHHSLVTWWEHVDFDFFAVARTDFENQDSCDWLTENGWETGPSTLFNRTYHSSHILGENQVHSFQQALFQRIVQEMIDFFWWAAGLALLPQRNCRFRTLSLCYIDPAFWIACISKIGEGAQESFNLSPGRNSHCSIKVRVLIMWPQPVQKCSGILQSGNITRIRWVRLPEKR